MSRLPLKHTNVSRPLDFLTPFGCIEVSEMFTGGSSVLTRMVWSVVQTCRSSCTLEDPGSRWEDPCQSNIQPLETQNHGGGAEWTGARLLLHRNRVCVCVRVCVCEK